MKLHFFLPVLAIVFSCAACHNTEKTAETAAVSNEIPASTPERTTVGNLKADRVYEGSNPDSAGTFQNVAPPRMVNVPMDKLPTATTSRKAYLSTGWWSFSMAYQANDTTIFRNYKPKWLKFKEDQTFDILVNNKVVNTGRWNWDEDASTIYLSCPDPYINNTWKVKEKGFVMIWLGNTDLNLTGAQIRVVDYKTPPPGN